MRLPFFFVVILAVVAILVDLYILKDIREFTKRRNKKWPRNIYFAVMAIEYILLIAILCLPVRSEDSDILPLMWLLYSFLSLLIPKIIYFFFSVIGRTIKAILRRKTEEGGYLSKWGSITGAILGFISFIVLWWGVFFTRTNIQVNEVEITSETLPDAFNGYKIVQISDLHVGTWGENTKFVEKLVERINGLNADLVVFTGDIVNRRTDELKPFIDVLSQLKGKDGVISVLGNHDYGDYIDWKNEEAHKANNRLLAEWERKMGWRLLNNEHEFISRGNDSIVVIGVENWGEPPFPEYGKLTKAYPAESDSGINLKDSRFKILLTHNPEHWNREVLKISNIDLSLSGHTHAMQMMFSLGNWKWSPSVFKYSRWGGLFTELNSDGKKMNLYVNIGSGEVGMPSRIGTAYPEITVITLQK